MHFLLCFALIVFLLQNSSLIYFVEVSTYHCSVDLLCDFWAVRNKWPHGQRPWMRWVGIFIQRGEYSTTTSALHIYNACISIWMITQYHFSWERLMLQLSHLAWTGYDGAWWVKAVDQSRRANVQPLVFSGLCRRCFTPIMAELLRLLLPTISFHKYRLTVL